MLLDTFLAEAKIEWGELSDGMRAFLGHCVKLVPVEGLMTTEPIGRELLLGEIDSEEARQLIAQCWDFHYNYPFTVPLQIIMSSGGGDVDAGALIVAELNHIRKDRLVNIHVAGFAHSTAFDILQCADHRSAEPTASLMTHHEHFGLDEGTSATSHKAEGEASIKRAELVFTQLSARTGRPVSYYMDKIHAGEWYLSADEALREGLIDEVAIARPWAMTPARDLVEKPAKPRKPRAPRKPKETTTEEPANA